MPHTSVDVEAVFAALLGCVHGLIGLLKQCLRSDLVRT